MMETGKIIFSVKIMKAALPTYWYANKIGEVIQVIEWTQHTYKVYDNKYGDMDSTKYIDILDCKIIS